MHCRKAQDEEMLLKVKRIYWELRRYVRRYYPKKKMHSIIFADTHSYEMNWEKPKTYDEKLHYVMACCFGREEAKYADKLMVRDYVKECGYEDLLPKLYGVWDSTSKIDLSTLPSKFVLKTNHACGGDYYLLCKDKENILWDQELKRFEKALHKTFWDHNYEYHYKYIVPKVYAEELLENSAEERMIDYKIHCFAGVPYCILVCSNRAGDLKLDFYDPQWNYMDICPEKYRSGKLFERPKGLEVMLEAAAKLSRIFPAARIDFYDVDGKVYFGEITLTPGAGNLYYIRDKYQKIMGDLFVLPKNHVFTIKQ